MNNKITFPRLATMLADKSGRSKRFSEDFLREFFSIISEQLESGESVKIKGLGTFRLSRVEPRKSVDVTTGQPMEISGHSKVVFVPAKEMAEAVNAPFEAFTSIEISDDADIQQLLSKEEEEESSAFSLQSSEEEVQSSVFSLQSSEESENSENSDIREVPEDAKNAEDAEDADNAEDVEDVENVEDAEDDEDDDNADNAEDDEEDDEVFGETGLSRKRNWIKGILISFVAAIVALIATFAVWYIFATNDFNKRFNKETPSMAKGPVEGFTVGKALEIPSTEESENQNMAAADQGETEDKAIDEEGGNVTEETVPTAPSDAVVLDTISTTRYLTTMAKKHYGNYNLWPYIYEENKAKLGHPDRIRPGTPVVIPKLSKYGVDANNPADIDKAKKLGVAIYARYGKSI